MEKVEVFENKRATGYNEFVGAWIPNYSYFLSKLPDLLSETKNKDLLVAGCGTGNEIVCFVKNSKQWSITGVDPSPEMIIQAKEKLKNYNNVNLIKGVVSDVEKTHKFGAATLLLVLHFMKDDGTKLSLLKSIAERLESNAPFVLLDITGTKKQLKDNLQVLKQLLPNNLTEEDINNRFYRIENELNAVSEERLSELLIEAGFEAPVRFFQTSIYMGWITKKWEN
ncbi:class I SAM-dependent methyltransferase [uncultured Tenacibaculum sp.]|uniref:class I SAM-dependent methyltransferase n=1 Tax=uncultured Tenacibaculum sp. TaxID=174713 RepID=UPI00260B3D5B|nr:class I SAM-dependent methyltransferase [uncultured Tenacibaculum sp.]